jgi:hypothetical protein
MVQSDFDLRLMVEIALRKNVPRFKKKQSLEPFSYFGHKGRKLIHIEMNIMGFIHKEEIYKSVKEAHCPTLLGFVRK